MPRPYTTPRNRTAEAAKLIRVSEGVAADDSITHRKRVCALLNEAAKLLLDTEPDVNNKAQTKGGK